MAPFRWPKVENVKNNNKKMRISIVNLSSDNNSNFGNSQ